MTEWNSCFNGNYEINKLEISLSVLTIVAEKPVENTSSIKIKVVVGIVSAEIFDFILTF